MMNRPGQGRKRKPIEQHIEDGTLRTYHEPETVPAPIPNRPACPAHLRAFDSAVPVLFASVCDWLEQLGTLSESDGPTIEAFVEAYYHHRKCLELLDGNYTVTRYTKTGDAYEAANPLDKQCRDWLDKMNRYANQLGLSPSARAALIRNAPPPQKQDDLESIMGVFGHVG